MKSLKNLGTALNGSLRSGIAVVWVFEKRQAPATAAKFITKRTVFIHKLNL